MVSESLTLVFSEDDSSPLVPPAVLAGEFGMGAELVDFGLACLSGGTVGSSGLFTGCATIDTPLISLKYG
jgi:hypothetical protein